MAETLTESNNQVTPVPANPEEVKRTFPSPFTFIINNPVPLVELRLRRFAREILEKPRWWEKVFDEDIVARWKREFVEHDRAMVEQYWGGEKRLEEGRGEKQWPRDPITEPQLRYLFDELRYLTTQRDGMTGISPTTIPMVYESPTLIFPELKASVRSLAEKLENVPDEEKDWHPGSNQQVLDLVHPSLFCLRIGRSFIHHPLPGHTDQFQLLTNDEYLSQRPDIRHSLTETWQRNGEPFFPFDFAISKAYQWLPTDFAVSEDGRVTPVGYINNLNPAEHPEAYQTISSVLERFIPMFERVASDELSPRPACPFPIDPFAWYADVYDNCPELDGDELDKWYDIHRWPVLPEIRPFAPPEADRRVPFSLRGRTIQVIVKMANIVLTPENPTYPGGSWHVEGMANETIVATGLYYYDSDNISESKLLFRAALGDGEYNSATMLNYEQYDYRGFLVVYGVTNDLQLNQQLGHVVAIEDKCVAFPNIYQHRVAPFELADRSRPGRRKILAFFLVDPLNPIHSTTSIPPQNAQWYRDAVYGCSAFQKLPAELIETILSYVLEGTVDLDQAKADREELMKERAQFITTHNEDVFEAPFSMCEH
ncbi:hypothetical protein FKP32DRAFT_1575681 [Trametes sanguinea]|nr:hypothetical protein FKP32DRAFT_1575681 [Trametes sanguinea]